jgi:hypothetical protein
MKLEHQQRDRDREHTVGEGLEAVRGHLGVFGGARFGPLAFPA